MDDFEIKISTTHQTFNKKHSNVSNFKLKNLKHAGFRIKNSCKKWSFELRRNWVWIEMELVRFFVLKIYKASEFELKPLQRFRFWIQKFKTSQKLEKSCIQKIPLWIVSLRGMDIVRVFHASSTSTVWKVGSLRYARFWRKIVQHDRFWIKQLRTSQKNKNKCLQKAI